MNPNPDPVFQVNPDPIRIQDFDEQNLKATGEAFSPQKRTFGTSKNESY
jgi:hypothetical protein